MTPFTTTLLTTLLLEEPLTAVNHLIQENWQLKGTKTITFIQQRFLEHFGNVEIRKKLVPYITAEKEGKFVRMWAVIRNNALEPEYVYSLGEDDTNHSLFKSCDSELGKNLIMRNVLSIQDASKYVLESDITSVIKVAYVYGNETYELNKIYELCGVQEDDSLHVIFSFPFTVSSEGVEDYEGSMDSLINYLKNLVGEQHAKTIAIALCSRVCQRVGGLLDTVALGNLSLCLNNFASSDKPAICTFLRSLFPDLVDIEINKEALEGRYLYPRVNLETSELESSPLQIVPGSCILLDESSLKVMQLNDTGAKNISALMELVKDMTVPYDFGYSEGHFPVDVPIIVLSSSSKSLLPTSLTISSVTINTTEPTDYLKKYVQVVRNAQITIPESLNNVIEKDFAGERVNNPGFNEKKLHVAISASRTLAAMRGLQCVGEAEWREGFEFAKL